MKDSMWAKPGRVTVHCRSTVLSRVEFSGATEVSPQAIGGALRDAVLHDNTSIQYQGGVVQRLAQGPIHDGGDITRLPRVSQ